MKDLIDTSVARSCACANMRQTDLVITQFYDGMLAPGRVSALQFSLLCGIDSFGSPTTNQLAQVIGMDRATLSRHLKVMACEELIAYEEGGDQYTKPLHLTQEGKLALEDSWPFWQAAQQRIETNFGLDRFKALLSELRAMRAVLNSAG